MKSRYKFFKVLSGVVLFTVLAVAYETRAESSKQKIIDNNKTSAMPDDLLVLHWGFLIEEETSTKNVSFLKK